MTPFGRTFPPRRWSWGRFVVIAPEADPSIVAAVERYLSGARETGVHALVSAVLED